ncbi:MAG: 1-acyl-sn-glycerol-3-phosphate acyltransferase [Rhizobiaceae bacterium]|nr:1-acyl-sn-glycerol-3-phosphate acyltransferase [Rhizobiaceae bacterium]
MSEALERRRVPAAGRSTWSERAALRVGAAVNGTDTGRAIQNVFLRGFGYVWMRWVLSRHMLIEGLETFRRLDPDRGVLLVCNHRSFFDLYAVSVAFFAGPSPWVDRLSFPVKGDFFYERPLGIVTNLIAGAGVMYPPFFRDRGRVRQNHESLRLVAEMLRRPGTIVGFHPEGTRGKGPDPHALLPMQPGAAEIALRSNALVVPVFINGLGNSLPSEIARKFRRGSRLDPCICVFGKPLDLSDLVLAEVKPQATAVRDAAARIGRSIVDLTPVESELRKQAGEGRIAAEDPRWLANRPVSPFYAFRG